ncbi:MAG: 8-oxo-dGTP diphosphatase [Firmicutes bacterium]|nr:8-oxo-dGTP diphosphatase [Bacillota bacterium]
MARTETVVLTNMCMVYDNNGNILVENRNDKHWGGLTFPGGHVEKGEPFVQSVIREVYEETGLTIQSPKLCGVKQFTHYEGSRYIVFFFKTDKFSGDIHSSDEGEVFWIKRSDLCNYNIAPDFDKMLEVFENDEISEFYYDGEFNVKLM